MKYPNNPELIATIDVIDNSGNEFNHGDRILGIQVSQEKEDRDAVVCLDIRQLSNKQANIVVRVSLPELIAALSLATLNADRDK